LPGDSGGVKISWFGPPELQRSMLVDEDLIASDWPFLTGTFTLNDSIL
jgi:hypothetical protein